MIRSSRWVALFAVSAVALGACKKKAPPVVAPQPIGGPAADPVRSNPTTPTSNNDAAAEAARKVAAARASLLATIYFEYDADDLRDDARATLDDKLKVLNANPQLRIRISGHCDDRGSDEYNIALGRRRAETAKRYLTDRGIDASRIETTTFGRERPEVPGSGEESWARNRRDAFEIIAGGDQLRAP